MTPAGAAPSSPSPSAFLNHDLPVDLPDLSAEDLRTFAEFLIQAGATIRLGNFRSLPPQSRTLLGLTARLHLHPAILSEMSISNHVRDLGSYQYHYPDTITLTIKL